MPPDGPFETFDTAENGLRAMAKILITYFHEGDDTIEDIINRWAPPSENNTDAYIDAVSDATEFDSDEIIVLSAETLLKLIPPIILHENGKQPYDLKLIESAIKDAMS